MDVLRTPVEVAAKGSCHAKGCKKYTCWYYFGY